MGVRREGGAQKVADGATEGGCRCVTAHAARGAVTAGTGSTGPAPANHRQPGSSGCAAGTHSVHAREYTHKDTALWAHGDAGAHTQRHLAGRKLKGEAPVQLRQRQAHLLGGGGVGGRDGRLGVGVLLLDMGASTVHKPTCGGCWAPACAVGGPRVSGSPQQRRRAAAPAARSGSRRTRARPRQRAGRRWGWWPPGPRGPAVAKGGR